MREAMSDAVEGKICREERERSVRNTSRFFRRRLLWRVALLFPGRPGGDHAVVAKADRDAQLRGADHLARYPDVSFISLYLSNFFQRQKELDSHFGPEGKGSVCVEKSATGTNVTRNALQSLFDVALVDRANLCREFEGESFGSSVISSFANRLQVYLGGRQAPSLQ
jgi:hypothetical protein